MKIFKFLPYSIFICTILISSYGSLVGQSKSKQKKWQQSINALKQTQFIQTYTLYKDSIETVTANYHRIKQELHPKDVEEVKNGYDESLVKFNKILDDVKKEFSNKEQRKYITSFPESYTQTFDARLELAMNTMNSKCLYYMEPAFFDNDVPSAMGLTEIVIMISIIKEFVGMIRSMNKKMEGISAEYIDRHLVNDLRLKTWDEY